MKYKLLKYIEKEVDTGDDFPSESRRALEIWDTFQADVWFYHTDTWLNIPILDLIEQGFIEEVKETLKPKWKVGDKVVKMYEIYSSDYILINRITLHSSGSHWVYNDDDRENQLRDPTPKELSTYFR